MYIKVDFANRPLYLHSGMIIHCYSTSERKGSKEVLKIQDIL